MDGSIKGVKEVSDTFAARKTSIETDINDLSRRVAETQGIVAEDFSRLKAMAPVTGPNARSKAHAAASAP